MFARDNLLVIDSGANYTYCVPVQDGSINTKAIIKSEIGGETLTKTLLNNYKSQFPIAFPSQPQVKKSVRDWGQLVN